MWPLIPLFWTSGDISGFQSQSGQPYSHLVEACVFLTDKLVHQANGDVPCVCNSPHSKNNTCFAWNFEIRKGHLNWAKVNAKVNAKATLLEDWFSGNPFSCTSSSGKKSKKNVTFTFAQCKWAPRRRVIVSFSWLSTVKSFEVFTRNDPRCAVLCTHFTY